MQIFYWRILWFWSLSFKLHVEIYPIVVTCHVLFQNMYVYIKQIIYEMIEQSVHLSPAMSCPECLCLNLSQGKDLNTLIKTHHV